MVYVAIENSNGQIYVTKCNCPVQAEGKCVHVACLCYFIDDIVINPDGPIISKACTSELQKWGKGKAKANNPKPLEDGDYGKKLKFGKKVEMNKYMKIDPRPPELRHTSQKEVEKFFDNLKTLKNNDLNHPNGPMWLHTLNKNTELPESPKEKEIKSPNPSTEYLPYWVFEKIFDHECPRNDLVRYKKYDLSAEELEFYKKNVLLLTIFNSFDLCKETMGQLTSQYWFDQRKIRITASKAHKIFRYYYLFLNLEFMKSMQKIYFH